MFFFGNIKKLIIMVLNAALENMTSILLSIYNYVVVLENYYYTTENSNQRIPPNGPYSIAVSSIISYVRLMYKKNKWIIIFTKTKVKLINSIYKCKINIGDEITTRVVSIIFCFLFLTWKSSLSFYLKFVAVFILVMLLLF